MFKRFILLILFLFPIIVFCQKYSDYDSLIQLRTKEVIDYVCAKSCLKESEGTIVYSTGTIEWFMILRKTDVGYEEYFVRFKRNDSIPAILEFSTKGKDNDTFTDLFDERKYWKGYIDLSSDFYKGIEKENLIHNNNSRFVFYDKNYNVISEFVLPLLIQPSPLDKHQAYINKRMLYFVLKYLAG